MSTILGFIVEGLLIVGLMLFTIKYCKNSKGFFFEMLFSVSACTLLIISTLRFHGYLNERNFKIIQIPACIVVLIYIFNKIFKKRIKR